MKLYPVSAILLCSLVACGGSSEQPTDTYAPTQTPAADVEVAPWENATVYFVMTDRFFDGNASNNESYGRKGDGGDEVGTFHGGDLAGLTQKLEAGYFSDLGVSALWISAPYEQIHGWVPGGFGDFQHYAYHGYYALDFTRLDQNMGNEEELRSFVNSAHAQGIRVIFDVVMNHPGYATIQDLNELQVDVLKPGWEQASLEDYYSYIDFESPNFANWWGVDWVRAGLGGGYDDSGSDELTMSLAYLPDFKTESELAVGLPPMFSHKADSGVVQLSDATVRTYMVRWLARWVEEYGIDGFRCDTAKHVDMASWQALKDASNEALVTWRSNNPELAFADDVYGDENAPFWMVGEVFPHGVSKDAYYDNGFDALINFNFAEAAGAALTDYSSIDETWSSYAQSLNSDDDFNVLSYLSSHDTTLFFEQYAQQGLPEQMRAAELLLLTPGAVQIFYGDENARPMGPSASDALQGTRSDYQWGANPELLEHWQKLGQFRRAHPAIGAGSHQKIQNETLYVFSRNLGDDVVYIALGQNEALSLDVSAHFEDGTSLREAYSQRVQVVSEGRVEFTANEAGVFLLEEM